MRTFYDHGFRLRLISPPKPSLHSLWTNVSDTLATSRCHLKSLKITGLSFAMLICPGPQVRTSLKAKVVIQG